MISTTTTKYREKRKKGIKDILIGIICKNRMDCIYFLPVTKDNFNLPFKLASFAISFK